MTQQRQSGQRSTFLPVLLGLGTLVIAGIVVWLATTSEEDRIRATLAGVLEALHDSDATTAISYTTDDFYVDTPQGPVSERGSIQGGVQQVLGHCKTVDVDSSIEQIALAPEQGSKPRTADVTVTIRVWCDSVIAGNRQSLNQLSPINGASKFIVSMKTVSGEWRIQKFATVEN